MGWILTGLANAFLEIINDLICWIMTLTMKVNLTIGYDPTAANDALFNYAFLTQGSDDNKSTFDQLFSTAPQFMDAFMIFAYGMIIIITIYKLYEGMISEKGESPLRVVMGLLFSGLLVTLSYSIFIFCERIANVFYQIFKDVMINIQSDADLDSASDVFNAVDLLNNDELFANQADMNFMSDITMIILVLILFAAMLFQLIKLFAEMFERYVVLGLLFYTSPLAFAMLTSKGTTDIFRKWVQMVMSQFVLMCMNLFFLGVFTGSMAQIFDRVDVKGYAFQSDVDFLITMMLLIGWLTVGQKVDEHLRSLGLSISQCGHSLGAALFAGAMTAKGAIREARSVARPIGKAGSKLLSKGASAASAAIGASAAGIALKNAAGWGPAQVVNEAERINGKLTAEGASAIMGTAGANLKGAESRDGMKAIGIDPDSKAFNTARSENGAMQNKHADADWNKSSMGDGLATIANHDGQIISQFGDASKYEVPNGAAAKTMKTEAGLMTYAATSDIVAADTEKVLSSINASSEYGQAAGVNWTNNGNGTLTGTDSNGNVWQAAPDYIAQSDPSLGRTSSGKVDDVSYTVQKMNRSEDAGFTNIRPAASGPQLIEKSAAQKRANKTAHDNARFMKDKSKNT